MCDGDLRIREHSSRRVHDDAAQLSGKQRAEFDIANEILTDRSDGVSLCSGDIRGGRRQQIRGDSVTAEVFHLVLLGEKDFPLQQIDGHVHFRKRKIGAAFFRKRRAGVHEHKGNKVGVDGTKARTQ